METSTILKVEPLRRGVNRNGGGNNKVVRGEGSIEHKLNRTVINFGTFEKVRDKKRNLTDW